MTLATGEQRLPALENSQGLGRPNNNFKSIQRQANPEGLRISVEIELYS
jgi:hypothetical protein